MLQYTAAAFPWWSSRPPDSSAAWGQREPWVQLAALAATWCSAPRSGGQNPRKLCQDGARIKGIGASAVGSGDMLDEMRQWWDCSKQTSFWMESNIVICMYLYSFAFSNFCRALSINSNSAMLWRASTSREGRRCSDPLSWMKGYQGYPRHLVKIPTATGRWLAMVGVFAIDFAFRFAKVSFASFGRSCRLSARPSLGLWRTMGFSGQRCMDESCSWGLKFEILPLISV